ncbi:MAG: CvpA family protein [Clostridiaceae bacterium]|jgi:uncharacterized membrane protein required for colicin V production|nr:CvpA family protein [Clostridiaceae bacterium]
MSKDRYGNYQRTNIDKMPLIILLVLLIAIILMDYLLKWNLNWVDYTIIGVVFFSAFVGYLRGLIRAVFSLAGYIIAIICAVLFSEPLSVLIMEKTNISEAVVKALQDAYSNFTVPAFSQTVDFSVFDNSSQLLENYPVFKQFLNENMIFTHLFESAKPLESATVALESVVTSITDLIVFSVLKVVSIIVVFIVVKLIVTVIGRIINSLISYSDLLSTTNKTIGLALGLVIGSIVIYIAVSYVIPFMGSLSIVNIPQEYTESIILKYIFTSEFIV